MTFLRDRYGDIKTQWEIAIVLVIGGALFALVGWLAGVRCS